jgi:hypothetical protein
LQGGQAQIEEKHIKDARPIFSSTGGEDLARVSKVYESDFGNVALWANADGDIGIGTETIPHGGIGWAKVAIDGVDFDEAGPHMQFTTDADDYPVMQIFPWGHDETGINLDSYYENGYKSSTTDQNFQILATGGRLRFRYDSGVAAGAALSWNEGIALRTDGTVGIGTITPGAQLESVLSTGAQLRLSHTTASKFLDITVDTNHDATFKPSSTGQIIFQPTTDSADFFQVLDADGGLPVLNVDAANERVAIGTGTPLADSLGTHRLTVYTTSNVGIQFGRFSANTGGPIMSFVKSRGASIGTHGAVLAGDRLGTIVFSGSDGTDFSTPVDMAQIYAEVDAVTGGTVYSGRLKFQTTNTSGTQTVAMTIDDGQRVGIGTVSPSTPLHVTRSDAGSSLTLENLAGSATSQYINSSSKTWNFGVLSGASGAFAITEVGVASQVFVAAGGNFGIGVSAPQGILHTYDTIGGFLIWEYDGLDATVRTVVPNGAGDCLYRLQVTWVFRNSAGVVVSGSIGVSNGSSTSPTVGTDTVRIRVNADGSIDVARTVDAANKYRQVVGQLLAAYKQLLSIDKEYVALGVDANLPLDAFVDITNTEFTDGVGAAQAIMAAIVTNQTNLYKVSDGSQR